MHWYNVVIGVNKLQQELQSVTVFLAGVNDSLNLVFSGIKFVKKLQDNGSKKGNTLAKGNLKKWRSNHAFRLG